MLRADFPYSCGSALRNILQDIYIYRRTIGDLVQDVGDSSIVREAGSTFGNLEMTFSLNRVSRCICAFGRLWMIFALKSYLEHSWINWCSSHSGCYQVYHKKVNWPVTSVFHHFGPSFENYNGSSLWTNVDVQFGPSTKVYAHFGPKNEVTVYSMMI